MNEYTNEWLKLQALNDIRETEDQQITRYIEGLRAEIRRELSMHDIYIYSLSDAKSLASKAEANILTRYRSFSNKFSCESTSKT